MPQSLGERRSVITFGKLVFFLLWGFVRSAACVLVKECETKVVTFEACTGSD